MDLLAKKKISNKDRVIQFDDQETIELRGIIYPIKPNVSGKVVSLFSDFELVTYTGPEVKLASLKKWDFHYKKYSRRRVKVFGRLHKSFHGTEILPLKIIPDDDVNGKLSIQDKILDFLKKKKSCHDHLVFVFNEIENLKIFA